MSAMSILIFNYRPKLNTGGGIIKWTCWNHWYGAIKENVEKIG